jgi:hypothetical protein
MPISDEQFEQLAREVRQLTGTVTEYTVVTRRHISEQGRVADRIDRMLIDHESRLRGVEKWQAGWESRLPARMLDAGQVESDIESLQREVGTIRTTLARYAGGVLAIWAVAQVIVVPGVQALWRYAFGG